MEIKRIAIDGIKPAKYNPRKDLKPGDIEYEKLKKSINEFDCVEPLVWNKQTGNLVGGHQRLKILLGRGDKEVDVSVVDLDDKKEKALNLALNKISGEWDLPMLKDILEELDIGDFDMEITGFDAGEIEDLMTQFYVGEEDDFDVDKAVEAVGTPISKRGDIWQLGEHRLMCGDATVEEDVKKLMDGKKADCVFTDPPYGIDYSGGRTQVVRNKNYGKIRGDKDSDISIFIESIINNDYKRDCYICVSPINLKPIFQILDKYNGIIVWKKQSPGLGYQFIRRYCEFIIFLTKRKKGKLEKSEFDYWEMNTDLRIEYQHGTQKPIALSSRAIKYSSVKDDLIVDWYGGSGSTLIACEQLNRKCFMMEIDPKYVDVCVERWENFTNKKAELQEMKTSL